MNWQTGRLITVRRFSRAGLHPCAAFFFMGNTTSNIEENAKQPKSVSADNVDVSQHSLRDQIEADKYLRNRSAANKKRLPIRFQKVQGKGIG